MIASSLLELKLRGAEKLGYTDNVSDLKVVLEADGTEVEDDGYFQTAEKDSIFILLLPEEKWLPLGVEALKTALSAIPGLVSEALNKLEASDKLPNWKVADNNGVITVVLSWDTRDRMTGSPIPDTDLDLEVRLMGLTPEATDKQHHLQPESPQKRPAQSPPILKTSQSSQYSSMQQQPISSQSPSTRAKLHLDGLMTAKLQRITPVPEIQHSFYGDSNGLRLEYDTDSDEDKTDQPSPPHDHTHCDFHCSALHRQIQIKKSVATSPITESIPSLYMRSDLPSSGHHLYHHPQPSRKATTGKYVRFQDEPTRQTSAGSDSETETTDREDEQLCERYLLLVDPLSIGHERHLSIKDIGSILERLSCKIVDVDKLERESETADCYNWVIRALIRGESLREIGVVYNGQYFGIIEHPGYF